MATNDDATITPLPLSLELAVHTLLLLVFYNESFTRFVSSLGEGGFQDLGS